MANACIAIGIEQTAGQGLARLPGAVTGARAIAAWAQAAGYTTELVVDRGDDDKITPVDVARVSAALMRLLPTADDGVDRGGPVDPPQRLIVYFAGHGMQSAADGELWLLSDSYNQQVAIGIARLQAQLQGFVTGTTPGQITIISDACRSPMIAQWNVNMAPVGVIPRGPYNPNDFDQVDIDQFLAVPPLSSAFMLRATKDGPARCIFTSVLLEALHGTDDTCFDTNEDITSDTLASYLRNNVHPRSVQYGVEMRPRVFPCFIEPHDVYASRSALKQMALPPLEPWPGAGLAAGQGADADSIFKSIGAVAGDVRGGAGFRSWAGFDMAEADGGGSDGPEAAPEPMLDADEIRQQTAEVMAVQADESARENRANDLLGVAATGQVATHYETQAGLSVIGRAISGVSCAPGYGAEPDGQFAASLRIIGPHYVVSPIQSTWALVDLDDGRCVATTVMGSFITTCIVGDDGCTVASCRPLFLDTGVRLKSELLLIRSEFARSDANCALTWLLQLTGAGPFDPMLGVLAAYVFHAAGQQDNVRRVAGVFADRGLALPFDIALLTRAFGRREADGTLVGAMGPTRPRKPRSPAEKQMTALLGGRDAFEVPVAGRYPLLRQGWYLLDRARDQLVAPGLAELAGKLAPTAFATFDAAGGAALRAILETNP